MKTPNVLETFRVIAPEFEKTTNKTVNAWITLTEPLVSKRRFGSLHTQALAFLTAHRMKMSGVDLKDENTKEQLDKIGILMRSGVGSFSEGQTSISLNHNAGTSEEDELAMTEYGLQFLSLRRKRIVPIVSSAEFG